MPDQHPPVVGGSVGGGSGVAPSVATQRVAEIGLLAAAGQPLHESLMRAALLVAARSLGLSVRVHRPDIGERCPVLDACWIAGAAAPVLRVWTHTALASAMRRDSPLLVSGPAALALDRAPLDVNTGLAEAGSRDAQVYYRIDSTIGRLGLPSARRERLAVWAHGWRPRADGWFAHAVATGFDVSGTPVCFEPRRGSMWVATAVMPEYADVAAGPHPLLQALVLHATALAWQQRRRDDPDRGRLAMLALRPHHPPGLDEGAVSA